MPPYSERPDQNQSRSHAVATSVAASGVGATLAPAAMRARALWENPGVRLAVGLAALIVVLAGALRNPATAYSGGDLLYFTGRVHDLLAGRDPYAPAVLGPRVTNGEYNDVFLYSPALYYLLTPLTLFGFAASWWIWSALNAAFLMGGCVALVKLMRPRASLALGLALAAAIALTNMARFELYFGNVDVLLLCLLATTALAGRSGRTTLMGVLLGLTPVVYLQALPIVLFYLWKREYRAVVTGAAVFAAVEGAGFLLAPAGALGHFWSMLTYFIGDWAAIYINQSLYGMLGRLFWPTLYSAGPLLDVPWLPALCWLALIAVVLALAGRRIARRPLREGEQMRAGLELAVAVAGLCLVFPMLEVNTFIIGGLSLIALALVIASELESRRYRVIGVIAVAFYLASCVGLIPVITQISRHSGLHGFTLLTTVLLTTPYLYLAVVLFALLCAALPARATGALQRQVNPDVGGYSRP